MPSFFRSLLPNARIAMVVAACVGLSANTAAAETIRVVAQKTGTFAWELDVVRAHGFDKAADLTIETRELASVEAGNIAISGGSTDLAVTNWLWVSRQRSQGQKYVFYPYSSALGAIMVAKDSSAQKLGDLKGKRLAVSGGPTDKSWLLAQAAAQKDGLELSKIADIVYGAPPLLFAKTVQGDIGANLTYWNFAARLEAKGFRRLIAVEDMIGTLGVKGRPALVGYVFTEEFADKHPQTIRRFIEATQKAKDLLAESDAEWQRIAPLVGTKDPAELKVYRQRYREGIPRRPIADEEADARTLFAVLAKIGGRKLVGESSELAPGTFYHLPAK